MARACHDSFIFFICLHPLRLAPFPPACCSPVARQGGHRTRREMYCRYVQTLVDLHCGLKNHVEAGVAMLQHIAMYQWQPAATAARGSILGMGSTSAAGTGTGSGNTGSSATGSSATGSQPMVDALGDFPAETEAARKERLFHLALRYFDEGEAWEKANELAEELRVHYQSKYQVCVQAPIGGGSVVMRVERMRVWVQSGIAITHSRGNMSTLL